MTTVDKQKQKASPLGGDKKRAAFLPAVPAAPVTVFLAPASGRWTAGAPLCDQFSVSAQRPQGAGLLSRSLPYEVRWSVCHMTTSTSLI